MKTLIKFIGIGLIVIMGSCKDDKQSSGTSYMNLRMTDAPGNFTAVNIDLKAVEVTGGGSDAVSINVTPGIYNLIDLSNGKTVLIATAALEPGRLEQIRLILGDNNSVTVDGNTYPLSTPSAQQSGLKLQVHKDLAAGVTYNMLLDFDANESIVQQGNGSYSLKPVVRVVDFAASGSVKGLVIPEGPIVKVAATSKGMTYTTNTNAKGEFKLVGIPEGTYTVVFYPPDPLITISRRDVVVKTGEVTDIGTVNLSGGS